MRRSLPSAPGKDLRLPWVRSARRTLSASLAAIGARRMISDFCGDRVGGRRVRALRRSAKRETSLTCFETAVHKKIIGPRWAERCSASTPCAPQPKQVTMVRVARSSESDALPGLPAYRPHAVSDAARAQIRCAAGVTAMLPIQDSRSEREWLYLCAGFAPGRPWRPPRSSRGARTRCR